MIKEIMRRNNYSIVETDRQYYLRKGYQVIFSSFERKTLIEIMEALDHESADANIKAPAGRSDDNAD